jgi:TM2 domain-containing membrane protein YozV
MLKTRFFLICIFLCVTLSTNRIFASDYYSNALRSFSDGNFYVASIEFERAIFYETDNTKIARCKYYKSLCYKELGDRHKALEELSEINVFHLPDSLFFFIRYEQAVCNFLNNDPTQALWNLEEIRFRFCDSVKTVDILPLNILCLNSTRNWGEAVKVWNYLLNHTGLKDSEKNDCEAKINKLYNKRKTPKLYSGKKAENLSRFIPGAGQMYCGAVFEGTFNLIMNASLLGYSFFEFYSKYYFTGYFVGLGIFNKTYNGGMHRAKLLADEKNLEGINKFNVETSSLLIRILDSRPLEKSLQQGLYKAQIRNSDSIK